MKKKLLLTILALLVLVTGALLASFPVRLFLYAQISDEVKFSAIMPGDWDTAYVDYEVYDDASAMKEKYQLEGNAKKLSRECDFSISFCKDGKIKKSRRLTSFDITFEEGLETFSADARFSVSWGEKSAPSWRYWFSAFYCRELTLTVKAAEDV